MRVSDSSPDEPVSISYDSGAEAYVVQFDSDVIAPSMAIVEAMARILDTTPTDLDPLADTIDPMAIDRLVDGDKDGDRRLEFQYTGHVVCVRGRGVVEICAQSGED